MLLSRNVSCCCRFFLIVKLDCKGDFSFGACDGSSYSEGIDAQPWVSCIEVCVSCRKLTAVSLISEMSLMVSWNKLRTIKKEHSSWGECGNIINISSIYLHYTCISGCCLMIDRKPFSSFPIKMMA